MKRFVLIPLLFLLVICSQVWGATVYVEDIGEATPYYSTSNTCGSITTGDTSGDLQAALVAAILGAGDDILYICTGTYTGSEIDGDYSLNVSARDGVEIYASGGLVTLDNDGNASNTINVNNSDNITIGDENNWIYLTGSTNADLKVYYGAGSCENIALSHIKTIGSQVDVRPSDGSSTEIGTGLTMDYIYSEDSLTNYGMVISGAPGAVIGGSSVDTGNWHIRVTGHTYNGAADALRIIDGTVGFELRNVYVYGNQEIGNNAIETALNLNGHTDLPCSGTVENAFIDHRGNYGYALKFGSKNKATDVWTVKNSILLGGTLATVIINVNCTGQIYNSVIYGTKLAQGGTIIFGKDGGGAEDNQLTLKNNIIWHDSSILPNRVINYNSADTTITSDYNIYFNSAVVSFMVDSNDSSTMDWAAWKSAGNDAHSYASDPLFVNPSANDYRLTKASPANGTGDPTVVVANETSYNRVLMTDSSGNLMPWMKGKVSIGAYQHRYMSLFPVFPVAFGNSWTMPIGR